MEMTYDGAMVMPAGYAMIDADEMTYLEGGAFVTQAKCQQALAWACIDPNVIIAATLTFVLAKKLIQKVSACGGLAAWAVGAILGFAATQIIEAAKGIARGALNKGVDITWNWNPFKGSFGVNCDVRT